MGLRHPYVIVAIFVHPAEPAFGRLVFLCLQSLIMSIYEIERSLMILLLSPTTISKDPLIIHLPVGPILDAVYYIISGLTHLLPCFDLTRIKLSKGSKILTVSLCSLM